MKKFRVSDAFFTFGFSIVLLFAMTDTLGVVFRRFDLVVMTLSLTAAFSLMSRFKWLAIACSGAAVLFMAIMWKSAVTASFVDFLGSFAQWMWGLNGSYEEPGSVYTLFAAGLLCLVIVLPFFMLVRYNAHVILPFLVGPTVFFIQQWMGFPLVPAYFLIYVLLVILYAVRQAMPRDGGKGDLALLASIPLCLALLAAAMSFPAYDGPAAPSVISKAGSIFSGVSNLLNLNGPFPGSQDTPVIDYGDIEGDLGGQVYLSDATVLFVQSDRPVYLKGRSYETFTGRKWLQNAETTRFRQFTAPMRDGLDLDYVMTHYGTLEINIDNYLYENWQFPLTNSPYFTQATHSNSEAYEMAILSIHYWDIITDKVFSPYWAVDFQVADEFADDIPLYKQENSDILADQALKKDFAYTVEAVRPNLTTSEPAEFYRTCYQGRWNDITEAYAFFSEMPPPAIVEAMLHYSERVAVDYTQLPDSITERTRELAFDITSELGNFFDKAAAIESYLRTNYTYTPIPSELPPDADFVDHFLFESKEGYCTYFATAMTVLCRCVGIPARYVEGYSPSVEKRDVFYIVTGQQAHAWMEVYLEGAGWVPFEPTTSFSSEGIRTPDPGEQAPPSALPPSAELPVNPEENEDIPPPDTTIPPQSEENAPMKANPLIVFISALAAVILLQLLRRLVFLCRVRSRDLSGANAERMYYYFVRALRVMKLHKKPGETPLEFAARADMELTASGGIMTMAAESFCKIRYGARKPAPEDREVMLKTLNRLEMLIKLELGWKLVFLRYVAGVV